MMAKEKKSTYKRYNKLKDKLPPQTPKSKCVWPSRNSSRICMISKCPRRSKGKAKRPVKILESEFSPGNRL